MVGARATMTCAGLGSGVAVRPVAATLGVRGEVAQLVEHTAENRGVAGSSPALATLYALASATRARLGTASEPSAWT